MSEKDERRLILPTTPEGLPNLEVRRMQRELEAAREPTKIHQETADEVSRHLDKLQRLTQEGKVRGFLLTALLTPDDKGHEALTLFSAPRTDKALCYTVLQYTASWLNAVAANIGPPDPPKAS